MPSPQYLLPPRGRFAAALLLIFASVPAFAAEHSLFDRFSFGVEGSTLGLDTRIRLDSELIGDGVEIDFERDLGLDSSSITPTFHFAWHPPPSTTSTPSTGGRTATPRPRSRGRCSSATSSSRSTASPRRPWISGSTWPATPTTPG